LHLRYKTSDISETKQSTAKVTTMSIETRVYGLSTGDKSGDLYIGKLLPTFPESKIFDNG